MKKAISLILVFILAFAMLNMVSCKKAEDSSDESNDQNGKYDTQIEKAIAMITESWVSLYSEYKGEGIAAKDYIKIINTRVIVIKSNPELEGSHQKMYDEHLKDVSLIVEFEILSDIYGYGDDYMANAGISNNVVFYTDGSVKVTSEFLNHVSVMYYTYNYAPFIEETIDFEGRFDRTIKLN